MIRVIISLIIFSVFPLEIQACSAYMCKAKNCVYLAKNFDWQYSHGYLVKNNKGVLKHAYNFKEADGISWVSKYGSITFNQIGKEFPFGGMNQEGLVVEQLWNTDNCEYEVFKNTPFISELEWIQYQLDNYKTVDEVVKSVHQLSIVPVMATIHYFIADQTGHSVIIEFINGETRIIENTTKQQWITNSSYENSEDYRKINQFKVDTRSGASLDRYCHLAQSVSKLNLEESLNLDTVFNTLLSTRTTITQWMIVYNLTDKSIAFLSRDFPNRKTIDLDVFNFEDTPTSFSNINSDKTVFKEYKSEDNKKLLDSFSQNFGINYVDYALLNTHQMEPKEKRLDSLFKETIDTRIHFNTKKNKGQIGLMLVNGAVNFKKRKAFKASMIDVKNNKASILYYSIPKGEYAILAFHDLNSNGKLDRNFLGIPSEPYAFSNNVKGFLGLPAKYDRAKVNLLNSTEIKINLR